MICNRAGAKSGLSTIGQTFFSISVRRGTRSILGTKTRLLSRLVALTVVVSLAASIATPSRAAIIQLDLTCSLNGLDSSGSCGAGPSFGTITLEDLSGVDAGKVEVTVDLGFATTQKFRDLILNYSGAATSITATDGSNPLLLDIDEYSITPYDGRFDLGGTHGQGWHAATSGAYSTVLSGNAPLSTSDFAALDTLGKLYAALHIQDIGSASGGNCDGTGIPACVPGMNGPGSLKIGAPDLTTIPEPSAMILLGIAAIVGWISSSRSRF
jgi:hypothetical protein